MSWTILVFIFGIQGAYPTSQQVGNYSSLSVCEAEKKLLAERFQATNTITVADPTQAAPKFFYVMACARRT